MNAHSISFTNAPRSVADNMVAQDRVTRGLKFYLLYTFYVTEEKFKQIFYSYLPVSRIEGIDSPRRAYDACLEVLGYCHVRGTTVPPLVSNYLKAYMLDEDAIFFQPEYEPHVLQYLEGTGLIHEDALCPFASRCAMKDTCFKASRTGNNSFSCGAARSFMLTDVERVANYSFLKERG